MSYCVIWLPVAEQELAALWLAADNRAQVSRAANTMDDVLARDGPNAGESRPDGRRIIFELPLAAIDRVNLESQAVLVLNVWQVTSRPIE